MAVAVAVAVAAAVKDPGGQNRDAGGSKPASKRFADFSIFCKLGSNVWPTTYKRMTKNDQQNHQNHAQFIFKLSLGIKNLRRTSKEKRMQSMSFVAQDFVG